MKKAMFGYKKAEVDFLMKTLRDENESLKAEIAKLNIQIKNNVDSAKAILLEDKVKNYEQEMIRIKNENNELKNQNENLLNENIDLKRQLAELRSMEDEAAAAGSVSDTIIPVSPAVTIKHKGITIEISNNISEYLLNRIFQEITNA